MPPTGEINISEEYKIGKEIHYYTITAEDDKDLKEILFQISDSSGKLKEQYTWKVAGKHFSATKSFSSENWKSGEYTCKALIKDNKSAVPAEKRFFMQKPEGK